MFEKNENSLIAARGGVRFDASAGCVYCVEVLGFFSPSQEKYRIRCYLPDVKGAKILIWVRLGSATSDFGSYTFGSLWKILRTVKNHHPMLSEGEKKKISLLGGLYRRGESVNPRILI